MIPELVTVKIKKSSISHETKIHFVVVGVIKSPQKRSFEVKWYQAVRITEEVCP